MDCNVVKHISPGIITTAAGIPYFSAAAIVRQLTGVGLSADECDCDGNGWVSCWSCMGEGDCHDCGEDTCCCAEPEMDEMWPCEQCKGKGGWPCHIHGASE